jgi:hypothetical protein
VTATSARAQARFGLDIRVSAPFGVRGFLEDIQDSDRCWLANRIGQRRGAILAEV